MEIEDEIFINASKNVVFKALNDPEVLQQCIPGCEELIKVSDTELTAKVVLKVGPVKAKFSGDVVLNTDGAPDSFSLSGSGNGGVAGYAKGGADVDLIEQDGGTLLKYTAKADIGGKLAQLGSRLVLSTAKKLSKNFFEEFDKVVTGGDSTPDDPKEKSGFWNKLVGD